MDLQERIKAFALLGDYLRSNFYSDMSDKVTEACQKNAWFTKDDIKMTLLAWGDQLTEDQLYAWISPYSLKEVDSSSRVLIIMAGNIPLVGFHDLLSVLISGNKAVVKLSSNDNTLISCVISHLIEIASDFKQYIQFIDDAKDKSFDAVIATGSDNSAQYFDYYFKGAKKIIRKNRRSIAVLDGGESELELEGLANDIFAYFGLGCRNVSKVFLPDGYDLNKLFKAFYPYNNIVNHKKYGNNYDYNKAIFLMGSNKLIENGFILLNEEKSLFSPVAMLYYEYYSNINLVEKFITNNTDSLQCVVSKLGIPFGQTQKPNLWDYADGIDTVNFLMDI